MKKKNMILTLALIVCVGFLVGSITLFNDMFPKAPPIRHPELEEIVSVTLNYDNSDDSISIDKQYCESLIQYISKSKSTRVQSWNDYPSSRPYYRIEIQTNDIQYRYFIYEDDEKVYIEMPYEGIYETNEELFSLVLAYFE